MAHPLNRPRFDPAHAARRRGLRRAAAARHAVAADRPRGLALPARVLRAPSGIDPYAAAVSDVYQDLFGEGSYTGKGIYDVDAFEAALAGRVPENTLLSHDLFEGIFARAGLVSDIEVVEEFPARYDVAAARQHRWARGDWQLLPWIFGRAAAAARRAAAIPLIGRWKMLDNLRRIAVGAGGARSRWSAGWTLPLARGAASGPAFVVADDRAARCSCRCWPRSCRAAPASRCAATCARSPRDLRLAAVADRACWSRSSPHQAWLMADAIVRTLFRLFVSAPATARMGHRGAGEGRRRGSICAGSTGGWRAASRSASALPCVVAVARAGAWPLAAAVRRCCGSRRPAIALLGEPVAARRAAALAVRRRRRAALRLIARRTWRFFETFVTPADNMLPPDNFQEDPKPVVAHRTSPTNIGLYLLSVVAARDFGWIGTLDAVERLEATLATMERPASASAATSSTGTTRATCGRSSRATSRRSTAAISPAT